MVSRKTPSRSRSERRRRAIRWKRISLGILGGLSLILVVFSAPIFRFVSGMLVQVSDRFLIEEVVIKGTKHLPQDSVGLASELKIGMKLFAVHTGEVEERLRQAPWIRDAQVIRRFPRKVEIRVTERVPLASVRQEKFWVITQDSMVVDAPSIHWNWDVPILTPPHSVAVTAGKRLRDSATLALLNELNTAYEVSGSLWANCSELYYRGEEIFCVLNEPDIELRLGHGTGDLAWIGLSELLRDEREPQSTGGQALIDLRFPGKLVVIPITNNQTEQRRG